jgi:O-antigen/teichoic acid export membrane protein
MNLSQIFWKILRWGDIDAQMKLVKRRMTTTMALRILRIGVNFILSVLIARMLGAEGAGVYFLCFTVIQISTAIGRAGMDSAITRYVAAHAAQSEWRRVAGVYRSGILIGGCLSLLVAIVVFAIAPVLASTFAEPKLTVPLRWMTISIVPWSLVILLSRMLQGINRISESIFVKTIGISLINIPIMLLLTYTFGVTGAAISYTISSFIILILGYYLWNHSMPQLRGLEAEYNARNLIRTSWSLFWFDFTILFVAMLPAFFLGVESDSASVGIYNTVKRVSILVSAFITSINVIVEPQFASLYAKNQIEQMARLARNSAKLNAMISIPIFLFFTVGAYWILSIFGPEFTVGVPALIVLMIAQLVRVLTGPVSELLIMSRYEVIMRNTAIMTSILTIILLFLLVPMYDFVGAALAIAIGIIVRNLAATFLVYSNLSIIALPLPDRMLRKIFKDISGKQPARP